MYYFLKGNQKVEIINKSQYNIQPFILEAVNN